ncbi:hypothetical protein BH09PSE2_BH09PSE2_17480 [soil metagenome]
MTPQERDLLARFLDDLARSNPGPKDREAADQIDRALSSNPDAAYVLVQHAILSDQALHAAQDRIAELEGRGPEGGGEPSFLGAAFGKAPSNPQNAPYGGGTSVPPTPPAGGGFSPFGQSPSAQAAYAQPWGGDRPGPFSGGGGVGSFLRSAGTTAAGVAGGAFLFEGLSNMFGGHRGGGFGGFGGGQGFMGGPTENVTINEYGDRDGDRSSFADTGGDVNYDSDNGDISGDDYS